MSGVRGASWLPLLACLAVAYLLTTVALHIADIAVVVPWKFVVALAVLTLPAAFCVSRLLAILAAGVTVPARRQLLGYVGLGLLLIGIAPELVEQPVGVLLCAAWLARSRAALPLAFYRTAGVSIAAVVLGYGAVWNLNYLLAPTSAASLHDTTILRADLAVYGWLRAAPVEARNLFPLVTSPALFAFVESAYEMLFVELFVVIFVLAGRQAELARFLRTIFICYFLGLLVFAVYPVVGPCIAFPESFAPEYAATRTHQLMRSMAGEFAAIGHKAGVNGFAYFVALPSLHVALAVLFQLFLRGAPAHFWTFLPVNVLMAASTVLLGYHYLLDVPAGICAALLVRWAVRDARGSTPGRAQTEDPGAVSAAPSQTVGATG